MKRAVLIVLPLVLLAALAVFLVWASVGGLTVTYQGTKVTDTYGDVWISQESPLVLEVDKPLFRSCSYTVSTVSSPSLYYKAGDFTRYPLPGNADASRAFDISMEKGCMTVTPKGDLSEVLRIILGTDANPTFSVGDSIEDVFVISFFCGNSSEPVVTFSFGISTFTLPEEVVF